MNRFVSTHTRLTIAAVGLPIACLALAVYSLCAGLTQLGIAQAFDALRGAAPHNIHVMVTQWRLPRVVTALLLGAALGTSGAIFQSLMRNPLGSPDIMGFNTGAHSAVLIAIVLFSGGPSAIVGAALVGGILSAAVVYLLAWRDGIQPFRLIIIGIAIRALLVSLNTWLVVGASLESALTAGLWSAGSLNGMTWAKIVPVALPIAIALITALALSRRMHLLEMGDDAACALGVPVETSRLLLILTGVILTAAATAAAGPISFVALVAPQISRRLANTQTLAIPLAALTGALLLLAADIAAQRLFIPYQLPVGVVTVCIGGIYLIGLLLRESRKK
ncbi:iron-enterobactin ABC transporter permease [Acerihabitans sp. TG2]|uniref:iron-enterobactin ABC transporter permease n=1 Tax=Acerihabitans sp. TG2 TaxID=3096008 RepID=UPI002B22FD92|nr:iron-enterobactin ABC transporter permease [Acerihabitans sp. TG2]MEA9391499.1 iron-enterobactin ABC transporter permease [Acerihabitans sp. TG2]